VSSAHPGRLQDANMKPAMAVFPGTFNRRTNFKLTVG